MGTPLASPPAGGISHEVFDALALPTRERFAVWRQSVLPLFEPQLGDAPPQEFFARVDGFNLGQLVFCLAEFSDQRYVRRRGHDNSEADSVLIQLYVSGGYVGHNADRAMRVRPGDISLLDLAYPMETRAESSSALSLAVSRDLMLSYMGSANLSPGAVISADSALGSILRHHLTSVWRALRLATAGEAESISRLLLGAVAGAFAGQHASEACAPAFRSATLDAICTYIERNLASKELTTAHLCQRFACSRARLYRLFEPLGGVASYIRQARLERCRRELGDPLLDSPNVTEIAMRWGFSSPSHFSRLFRRRFGHTPSDMIERARARRDAGLATPCTSLSYRPALHDWLRRL